MNNSESPNLSQENPKQPNTLPPISDPIEPEPIDMPEPEPTKTFEPLI